MMIAAITAADAMGDSCCCNPCCNPCGGGGIFDGGIWIWIIVAIIIIWIVSDNNNCGSFDRGCC